MTKFYGLETFRFISMHVNNNEKFIDITAKQTKMQAEINFKKYLLEYFTFFQYFCKIVLIPY